MAIIVGLEEQKAALARVKHNLVEVRKINGHLVSVKQYLANKDVQKEYKLECAFTLSDDSLVRLKVPVFIDDSDFVLNSLQKHKDDIVKQIKEDASQYHISLSPQEEAILIAENHSEK